MLIFETVRFAGFIFVFLSTLSLFSQEQGIKREAYDRKEEVIYDGKRYRKYNNYLTLGGGYLSSSIRTDAQKHVALDFHFHLRREYFQVGIIMSGHDFLSNNNIQGHFGYGLRKEKANSNLAVYGGLTYYTGVIGVPDSALGSIPRYYSGTGVYICGQAVTKLTYDIGAGFELFGEYSQRQSMAGFKVFLFFSGAYVGQKKNYNPNVHSERGK